MAHHGTLSAARIAAAAGVCGEARRQAGRARTRKGGIRSPIAANDSSIADLSAPALPTRASRPTARPVSRWPESRRSTPSTAAGRGAARRAPGAFDLNLAVLRKVDARRLRSEELHRARPRGRVAAPVDALPEIRRLGARLLLHEGFRTGLYRLQFLGSGSAAGGGARAESKESGLRAGERNRG